MGWSKQIIIISYYLSEHAQMGLAGRTPGNAHLLKWDVNTKGKFSCYG